MKNKNIIIIITILIVVLSTIVTYDYLKSKKDNKITNIDTQEVILKDEEFQETQFPVFKICKNKQNIISYSSTCQTDESYYPYLTVLSPTTNIKTYEGSNYLSGILFKDNNIRLIDVTERKQYILELGENDTYKLIINNGKILGVIYQNKERTGFYSYKLKHSIYEKQYDTIALKDEILLGSKEKKLFILDTNKEKIIKELNNNITYIDDIIYAKNIENLIHIKSRNQNGEYEYFIFNKKTGNINKISGFYDEMNLIRDKIYALKGNTVEIYNINGEIVGTNTLRKGTHYKIVENYLVTLIEKDIKIINMDTKEETTLLENALNLWISEEKYEQSNNSIIMLFQEIIYDEYPKMYEVTFIKDTKEVKIKNFN